MKINRKEALALVSFKEDLCKAREIGLRFDVVKKIVYSNPGSGDMMKMTGHMIGHYVYVEFKKGKDFSFKDLTPVSFEVIDNFAL